MSQMFYDLYKDQEGINGMGFRVYIIQSVLEGLTVLVVNNKYIWHFQLFWFFVERKKYNFKQNWDTKNENKIVGLCQYNFVSLHFSDRLYAKSLSTYSQTLHSLFSIRDSTKNHIGRFTFQNGIRSKQSNCDPLGSWRQIIQRHWNKTSELQQSLR